MNKPMCSHPELYPTQWNQSRPEPAEMITCECGENATCPVCGFGWGSYPCTCSRKRAVSFEEALEFSMEHYKDTWEQLASM